MPLLEILRLIFLLTWESRTERWSLGSSRLASQALLRRGKEVHPGLSGCSGGQSVEERTATAAGGPIRLFPVDYPADEAYYPLVKAIAQAHPETFVSFKPWTVQLGSMLFMNLHDLIRPLAQQHFGEFTLAMETAMEGLAQDAVGLGFNLSWLSDRGSVLRAAGDRAALQPEIRILTAQVESTRQHLVDLEGRLA